MEKLDIHEAYIETYGSDAHLVLSGLDCDACLAIDAKYQALADAGEIDPDPNLPPCKDIFPDYDGPEVLADALWDMHKDIQRAVVHAFASQLTRTALTGILDAMALTCVTSRFEICYGVSLCGDQLSDAWAKAHPDQEARND